MTFKMVLSVANPTYAYTSLLIFGVGLALYILSLISVTLT